MELGGALHQKCVLGQLLPGRTLRRVYPKAPIKEVYEAWRNNKAVRYGIGGRLYTLLEVLYITTIKGPLPCQHLKQDGAE